MAAFDLAPLADALLPAVLAAGRIQMQYYRAGVAIERKADNSPVTEADRRSEAVLVAALAEAMPGIPVVAEEAASAGQLPSIARTFFLVDPLDGTREFIQQRGEFTINIGLIEDGAPTFGIVYAPALSELYLTVGRQDVVAARVATDSPARTVSDTGGRKVSSRTPDPQALVAVASRSHLTRETQDWLARFHIASYRQAGSSLKFCLVAAGEADVYPRHGETCEWDTAAGHAVLAAAGGQVTRFDGTPLRYGKAEQKFLNPHFVAWGRGGPALPAAP